MSWYPMDRYAPGDGDARAYDEESAGGVPLDDDGDQPDEPHDDETCTGDEDCDCPCVTCRGATEALHRL